MPPVLRGAPLGPGHGLAAVAPSGPYPADALAAGLSRWHDRRRPVVSCLPGAPAGYLAGADVDRAASLLTALGDPSVGALHAVRGGYGAVRVLEGWGPALTAALAARPVPLVGFSDITALHAAWWKAGVRSVHGIMLAAAGQALSANTPPPPDEDDFLALADVLEGAVPAPWTGLPVLSWPVASEAVEGVACGGNLTVLASLAGTEWLPRGDGVVWFLEDVTEAPYRIDRSLTQLRLAGMFVGARAIVLGSFTACAPGRDGVTVESALEAGLAGLGVPVLYGAPFGHGGIHRPWVQGAPVRVGRDGTVVHREGLA